MRTTAVLYQQLEQLEHSSVLLGDLCTQKNCRLLQDHCGSSFLYIQPFSGGELSDRLHSSLYNEQPQTSLDVSGISKAGVEAVCKKR